MSSQVIQCSKIRVSDRTNVNKGTVKKIAESIQVLGLLQPIGIRPIKDNPEFDWDIVYGRHRFLAVSDHLKEEMIDAIAYEDFDDEDAEMAKLAENLFRNTAKRAVWFAEVGRWAKLYESKYPEKVGQPFSAPGGSKKANEARKAKKAAQSEPETVQSETQDHTDNVSVSNEPTISSDSPAPVPSFADLLGGTVGVSTRTAFRAIKIGKNLTAEQLSVLEGVEATDQTLGKLSAIEDIEQRNVAVNLVASGMDLVSAIASATSDPVAVEAAKLATEESAAASMTDSEWLEKYCSEIRGRLGDNVAAFDNSASLYRKICDHRRTFKQKTQKAVDAASARPPIGHLGRLVKQFVTLSNPRDWLLCGQCGGKGTMTVEAPVARTDRCKGCGGDGFRLKFEN